MENMPDTGEERGWAWIKTILSEFWEEDILPLLSELWTWVKTPLGATVAVSVIGAVIILWRVFKK